MAGQVEFADVVVVNKVDLLLPPCESSLAMVQALVRRLNPRARVMATSYGKVDPQVRQAGRQLNKLTQGSGWTQSVSAVGERPS